MRCTVADRPSSSAGRPPYKPGSPFFFKVKFEEPYLLYRQFRETTRTMLPLLNSPTVEKEAEIKRSVARRAKRPEVRVYADWVSRTMKTSPSLFDDYGRGIVRVRDHFLAWTEKEGQKEWQAALHGDIVASAKGKTVKENSKEGRPKKWLLIPAAIPGCGELFPHFPCS